MLCMIGLGIATVVYASDDSIYFQDANQRAQFDQSLPVVSAERVRGLHAMRVTQRELSQGCLLDQASSYVVLAWLDSSHNSPYVAFNSLRDIAQSSAGPHKEFPLFVVRDTGQEALQGLPRFEQSSALRGRGRGNCHGRGVSNSDSAKPYDTVRCDRGMIRGRSGRLISAGRGVGQEQSDESSKSLGQEQCDGITRTRGYY